MAKQQYPDESKTIEVGDGITYAYIYKPAQANKATFLLLHGFPSSSYDWRHQITDLPAQGYGVIVPDLLGYGDTSKPEAKEEYTLRKITSHVRKVLDNENLKHVIAVGHDWGSAVLARFVNYHPQYVSAMVSICVPYYKPGRFDIDEMNKMMEQYFGYAGFGYQMFFIEPEAAQIVESNHDSFVSLLYPSDPAVWKTDVGPIGKAKEWVSSGKKAELPSWLSPEDNAKHSDILLRGGYTGPLNWYKAALSNILDDYSNTTGELEDLTINKPVLLIAASQDYISRPEFVYQAAEQGKKEGYLPNAVVKQLDCGHWVQLEKPKELADMLVGFAESVEN